MKENTASDRWLRGRTRAESALGICLLGGFEIFSGDEPLALPPTLKARSLLAYLVIHLQVCPREMLAGIFWPERPGHKALRSLSTALWQIRRVLPSGEYLLADAQTVRFNPKSPYWLDVSEFECLVRQTEKGSSRPTASSAEASSKQADLVACLSILSQAAALYKGDFLAGFYDEWCLESRYRLHSMYQGVLLQLATMYQTLKQPHEALQYAEMLLAQDPLREDLHRMVVQLHVQLNNRGGALRQAQWCRDILRSEMGFEPQPETQSLFDEMLGSAWRRDLDEGDQFRYWPALQGQASLVLAASLFGAGQTRFCQRGGRHRQDAVG